MRRLMSCLGDPSRYQLVSQLVRGERCVSDLARQVGLSQSCTTRHLQALQREQIVRRERAGKRVLFRLCLDEPQVGDLLAWAMAARAGKQGGRRTPRPVPARPLAPAAHHNRPPAPPADSDPDPVSPPPRPPRQDLEDYLL